MRCNNGLEIVEVVKFSSHTHVFKVEFNTVEHIEKAISSGLLCFNVQIASH